MVRVRKNFQKIFLKSLNFLCKIVDPPFMTQQVLLAEDDHTTRELLTRLLAQQGFSVIGAEDGETALGSVSDETTIAIVDLRLPKLSGFRCLDEFRKRHAEMPVIVISSAGTKDAVLAMKQGAFHFLQKPLDRKEVLETLDRAIEWRKIVLQEKAIRTPFSSKAKALNGIRFEQSFLSELNEIDMEKSGVYLQCPVGGPLLEIAKHLHGRKATADERFIHLDFSTVPSSAMYRQLFGGGSDRGLLGYANGGTVLLENVQYLSPRVQKLLGEFFKTEGRDTFCIAAGHLALDSLRGREDVAPILLEVFSRQQVEIPPLRERKESLHELVENYLGQLRVELSLPEIEVSHDALKKLAEHNWPGNDNEVYSVLERAVLRGSDLGAIRISSDDLEIDTLSNASEEMSIERLGNLTLCEIENYFIQFHLDRCKGNKSQAARNLGITDRTIFNRIQKFGLQLSH